MAVLPARQKSHSHSSSAAVTVTLAVALVPEAVPCVPVGVDWWTPVSEIAPAISASWAAAITTTIEYEPVAGATK